MPRKNTDRFLSSQAMTPASGGPRNSVSPLIDNFRRSPLSARLARRFPESRGFRRGLSFFLALLFLLTAGIALFNPLRRGLAGAYFLNPGWSGAPNLTTRERKIGLERLRHEYPGMTANTSILWTGAIFIPVAGEHRFTTVSSDGSALAIDGKIVVDNGGRHGVEERSGAVDLAPGFHSIRIRFFERTGKGEFLVDWAPPGKGRQRLDSALLFSDVPAPGVGLWAYRWRQVLLPLLLVFWAIGLAFFLGHPGKTPRQAAGPGSGKGVSLTSIKLVAFLLLNGLVLNTGLSLFSERTALDLSRFFLTSPVHAGQDSWKQIDNALDYLAAPHARSLYAEVFFSQRQKFQYPPTSLLLLEPFRGLPYASMVSAANFLSWLAIIVSTGILAAILSGSLASSLAGERPSFPEKAVRWGIAAGFTVTFYPLLKSFELGQIQTWLYFFFVLALWSWMSGKKAFAGILIGIICVIKPQLSLLLVWGLLRKQGKFVMGLAATAGTFGLVSLAVFGWTNHVDYVRALSFMAKHGESYHPNQSVNGLLNRLLFNGTNLHGNPHAFAPFNRWVYLGTLLSSAVLILFALLWKRRRFQRTGTADFMIAVLSFTLASPIAWEHHYSVLLPMFAAVLPMTLSAERGRRGLFWLGAAFVLSSTLFQATNALANTRLNVLQSTLFAGALMLLFHLYRLRSGPRSPTQLIPAEVHGLGTVGKGIGPVQPR